MDFDTHCRLIEIVHQAQKPLVIKKTTLVRNEKGEFSGSSFTDEIHMISTSKIIFEDKKGESLPFVDRRIGTHLWIERSVKVGTLILFLFIHQRMPLQLTKCQ